MIVAASGPNPLISVSKDYDLGLSKVLLTSANNAGFDGGAIHNEGGVSIDQCTIRDCIASKGGAIANIQAGSSCSVTHSYLLSNTATADGGAVYAANGSTVIIDDTTIQDNVAVKGGAIAAVGADIQLVNTTISHNIASQTGGGVYMSQGTLTAYGGWLINNMAGTNGGGDGGAINLSFGASAVLNGTAVTNNSAEGNGGGIIVSVSSLDLESCSFSDNSAKGVGPKIAYQGILDGTQQPGQQPNTFITINNCTGVDKTDLQPV
jgi:predicted outer membrane repeat protein